MHPIEHIIDYILNLARNRHVPGNLPTVNKFVDVRAQLGVKIVGSQLLLTFGEKPIRKLTYRNLDRRIAP
jgi:hypothetical protein